MPSNFVGNSWENYGPPKCEQCGAALKNLTDPPFGFCSWACQDEYESESEDDDEDGEH